MVEKDERVYKGTHITVHYDNKRCIHAAVCIRRLSAVFNTRRRPWVLPDAASADEVAEVVVRCPTGALHFERHDGGAAEAVPATNTVAVVEGGPLYFLGDVEVLDDDGELLLRDTRVGICRCGASGNRPLCDDAHFGIGFADCSSVQFVPPDAEAPCSGLLRVRAVKGGPLTVEGSCRLEDAQDHSVPVSNPALCRCGESRRKPLCDGSHARVGFECP